MRTGSLRTRTPVAWYTAAVIAGATPARPISPIPRAPKEPIMGSGIFRKVTSISGTSRAGRDKIVGKAVVDRIAVARVVDCLLQQAHADTHHDGACNLIGGGFHVDNSSAVNDAYGAADAKAGNPGVPFDLNKLGAKRMGGVVVRVGVGPQTSSSAVAVDVSDGRHFEEILKRHTGAGGLIFIVQAAVAERERCGILI